MINLLATGRPYFMKLALSIILGVLLLQGAAFYLYGHERMVQTAETFAMGVAERAHAIDSILKEQPELGESQIDFSIAEEYRAVRSPTDLSQLEYRSIEIRSAIRRVRLYDHMADPRQLFLLSPKKSPRGKIYLVPPGVHKAHLRWPPVLRTLSPLD